MSACIERHSYNCDQADKDVVMKLKKRLMSRVKDHCPEVKCDVCEAQKCMDRLLKASDDDMFCRFFFSLFHILIIQVLFKV
jgi:hypothetical protein